MRHLRYRTFPARVKVGVIIAALGALFVSCGWQPTYVVSELSVERIGWDTVDVEVSFSRVDGTAAASAPAVSLTVFGSRFDTLYTGSDMRVPVPDRRLFGSEPMLVEVCGRFPDGQVCEQRGILASPKRILVDQDISYPEDGDFDRGAYELGFVVERQQFGHQTWEPIGGSGAVRGYVLTYVGDTTMEGLRIPVRGRRARFNLARLDNYRDFSYHLRSSLMERNEARVHFDVYASIGGENQLIASAEKVLRSKSRRVRELEAGDFADQVSRTLLTRLDASRSGLRSYVYMKSWEFDEGAGRYRIALDILWASSFFGSRWYELRGTLEVGDDGGDAVFRAEEGNRRARNAWNDHVGDTYLDLGDLRAASAPPDVRTTVALDPDQSN